MNAQDPAALARRLLRGDRWAALAGATLVEVREGYARARLRLRPDHLNGVGVAQGGLVFTLADFAFAAASNSRGTVAVGLDTSMTFVRGPAAGTLTAEAREESLSRRVSVCTVRVTDARGELVALFRGTAFRKEDAIATLLAGAARARGASAPRPARGRAREAHLRAAGPGAATAGAAAPEARGSRRQRGRSR
jgi:acyl-CoA thioesterase